MTEEKAALNGHIAHLEARCASAIGENAKLKDEIKTIGLIKDELSDLKKKYDDLEERNKELVGDISELELLKERFGHELVILKKDMGAREDIYKLVCLFFKLIYF